MKIIHITPSYKPAYIYGGPIVSVSSLCESLADANIEICVLTTTANGKNRLKQSELSKTVDGVTIMYFRSINGHRHFSLSLLWKLNQELNAKNRIARMEEEAVQTIKNRIISTTLSNVKTQAANQDLVAPSIDQSMDDIKKILQKSWVKMVFLSILNLLMILMVLSMKLENTIRVFQRICKF